MSPIAYAKPGMWPSEDSALHHRYVEEMAEVVSQLLTKKSLPMSPVFVSWELRECH